ncbi:MAG: hypothetical protein RIR70_1291 [Pseudomonadota bacterium]|jgi:hypothetical protein
MTTLKAHALMAACALIGFFSVSAQAQQASAAPVAAAQATPPLNLAPGFVSLPKGATLALMPVDVELYVLSAGGVAEPKADWTEAAVKHVNVALQESAARFGATLSHVADEDADGWGEVSALHAALANAMAIHHLGLESLRLPTKQGKLDWSLREAVAPIREKTQADYALFVWVRDSYASDERRAAMVAFALLGVGLIGGMQVGYASLVDLRTGQVMWFNKLLSATGDLRTAEPARASVKALLANFPSAPDAAK